MLRFELTVRGQSSVANELRTAAAKAPKEMQEATYRWAQTVRAALKAKPYPAKRPGQKYVRTGRLANSWAVERQGKGVVIVNRAEGRSGPYSRFVIGDAKGAGQAWMHRGRWWTGRGVVDEYREALRDDIISELDRLFPRGSR